MTPEAMTPEAMTIADSAQHMRDFRSAWVIERFTISLLAGLGSEPRKTTNIARKRGYKDSVRASAPDKTATPTLGCGRQLLVALCRDRSRLASLPATVLGATVLGATVLGALILVGPVAAGNLTITPTVELRETLSDNVDLSPDGQAQSALTTEIVPGITLRSDSARATVALDAFPVFRHQTAGSDEGYSIAGDLAGRGTVEALEDLFFIDAQASISQKVLSNAEVASTANEKPVQVYRLSPYLQNRFGGFAEGEARYRISQVLIGDQEGAATTSDSTNHGLNLSLDSGADFTRLKWSVNLLGSFEDRSDDDDVSRLDSDVEAEYAFNRSISMLAAAGYQFFDDGISANDIEDPTWRVGLRWRPGPRTDLRVSYGQRDDDRSAKMDFKYDITTRTTVTASYSEVLEKSQERLVRNVSFIDLNPESDQFIDPQTGLPFDSNQSPFDIDNQTSRISTFRFGLNGVRGRNTFGFNGAVQNEKIEPTGENQDVISLGGRFARRLDPHLTLNLFAGYERIEFDDGQEDDEYNATAALNYQIFQNLRASLQYGFRVQNSTAETSEFTENRATASLRMTF